MNAAGFWRVVCAVFLVVVGAGCGYTAGSTLDAKYQTIHVAPFENRSAQYGLQAALTNAVRRKFINDSRLRVAPRSQADLLMEGVFLNYKLEGLTFDEDDEVTQFLAAVQAGVRVTDLESGEIVWENPAITGETTYFTVPTSRSSERLRGNAEAFISTIRAFSSEEENRAMAEALEQLASDIFYLTVEPW